MWRFREEELADLYSRSPGEGPIIPPLHRQGGLRRCANPRTLRGRQSIDFAHKGIEFRVVSFCLGQPSLTSLLSCRASYCVSPCQFCGMRCSLIPGSIRDYVMACMRLRGRCDLATLSLLAWVSGHQCGLCSASSKVCQAAVAPVLRFWRSCFMCQPALVPGARRSALPPYRPISERSRLFSTGLPSSVLAREAAYSDRCQ